MRPFNVEGYEVTPHYYTFKWLLVKPTVGQAYRTRSISSADPEGAEEQIKLELLFKAGEFGHVNACLSVLSESERNFSISMTISNGSSFKTKQWPAQNTIVKPYFPFILSKDFWSESTNLVFFFYLRILSPLKGVTSELLRKMTSTDLDYVADCKIHFRDGILLSHRILLSFISPFFAAKFSEERLRMCNGSDEGRIVTELAEFSGDDFRELLYYVCHKEVSRTAIIRSSNVKLARFLKMDDVVATYEHIICLWSLKNRFYEDLDFACKYDLNVLKDVSIKRVHVCWDAILPQIKEQAIKNPHFFFEHFKHIGSLEYQDIFVTDCTQPLIDSFTYLNLNSGSRQ